MRCIVCMSKLVPQNKIDAIRGFGAEVRIVGRSQDDAQVEAERLIAEDAIGFRALDNLDASFAGSEPGDRVA